MSLRQMALNGKLYAADGGYLRRPDGPEVRGRALTIRTSCTERRDLEKAAQAAGKSLATFAREILLGHLIPKK